MAGFDPTLEDLEKGDEPFPPIRGERYGFILFRWNDAVG